MIKIYRVIVFTLIIWVILACTTVYGLTFQSDSGEIYALSPVKLQSGASGQGTHSNFDDGPELDSKEYWPFVAGADQKTNRWVQVSWDYFAYGFDAEPPDNGNIFCGVFASSKVAHSQSDWDGPKSGSVHDSVSSQSNLDFEIAIGPKDENAPILRSIPFNIKVNLFMDIGGSSKQDMGNAYAVFHLTENRMTGRDIRILDAQSSRFIHETDEPVTFLPTKGEYGLTDLQTSDDDKYVSFIFENVMLKPETIYLIELSITAGAWSDFTSKETTSESTASGWMDPSIEFSPDFEYPNDFVIYVSPGLLAQDTSEEPKLNIISEQGGEEVNQIASDGGLVTISASTNDLNQDNSSTYLWSAMNSFVTDLDGNYHDSSFLFDPLTLDPGLYTMNVISFSDQISSKGVLPLSIDSDLVSEEDVASDNTYLLIALAVVVGIIIVVFFMIKKRK